MKNLIIIFLTILFSSCTGTKSDANFASNQPTDQSDGEITFQELQKVIVVPHCIRCHADFSSEAGVRKEIKPGDAENSHFFEHIRDGTMPPDRKPLSTEEMEVVRIYIDNLPAGPSGEDNEDHGHP